MIGFRDLRYFLVACEHENLGLAAKHIGIASSTLSASLKALEGELGVPLLRKMGSGISPLPSARWLYRAALPLMLIEQFTVKYVKLGDSQERSLLQLDIDLNFTFGNLTKAINRAAAASAQDDPLLMIHPEWMLESGARIAATPPEMLGFQRHSHVRLFADTGEGDLEDDPDAIELLVDPWLLVRRSPPQTEPEASQIPPPLSRRIALPDLPAPLIAQAVQHLRAHGYRNIRQLSEHPGSLPELRDEYADSTFMIPASIFAGRFNGGSAVPFDPPLHSRIMGRADPDDEIGQRFLRHLRTELNNPGPAIVFRPILTERRIRYFNLAHDLGRVSAAARRARIAQPALSQQLHKLETSLDVTLFERESFGLVATESGRRLAPAAELLERRLRELSLSGMSASLTDGGRLSIGILPSVNQHGYLVNRITEAVLQLRDRYPAMSLTVQEAPNATLQDWVTRGKVGIAVVETALPLLPRFALNATEELVVIADPRFNLLPPGPVRFRDAARLPLALPTTQFGLRQLVDAAAKQSGIDLKPRHQIDALTMLIGLLAREPICTILPASAVGAELRAGTLSAHPIIDPAIERCLFLVYSGDRSLTPAERELVTLLRHRLAEQPGFDATELSAVQSALSMPC